MARKQNNRDIEEIENAFRDLSKQNKPKAGKYASNKKFGGSLILPLCIAVAVIIAVILGVVVFTNMHNNKQITANISIAGYDVTGLSRNEAQKALEEHLNALYSGTDMAVQVEDQTVIIPYTVSQIQVDVEGAIDAAIKYSSNTNTEVLDLTPYISLNTSGVMELLQSLTPHFNSKLIQTTYAISGTVPEFNDKIDENASCVITITKGQPGVRLDIDALYHEVLNSYSLGINKTIYECKSSEPDPVYWNAISIKHGIEPVEAVMDKETFEVSGGTYGYAFDAEEASKAVENAAYGEVITLDFQWIKPEHTADELESMLFRDVLSSYTTYASYDYNRNTNLELAAAACNGIVLYPGDVFSFNGTLGERTPDKGYRPGASYVGGETVYDYGGGICQVATTLYYCSIVADLEIIERECHGYASSYTPLSTDATVFWNGIDYKFKNNTEYPIRIEAYSSNGDVTVSFIGTDTKDYYVKFEYEWLATYPFETIYKEMEEDNEKGLKDGDIITSPYTGYKSQGFRARYSKETDELIERVLESVDVYSSRDKVICKIIGTEEPTEPETTDPIPTEPTQTEPETTVPDVTDPETTPTEEPTETPTVTEEIPTVDDI